MLRTLSLQSCPTCGDLRKIIEDLGCYITVSAGQLLLGKKFALGKKVPRDRILKAIRLRNILISKAHNPSYAKSIHTDDIVSIAHTLIYQ